MIPDPYMTLEEKELILKYINKFKPKKILEYGIGWSTVHFSNFDFIENYIGIDHNKEWIDKMKIEVNKKVNLIHCQINDGLMQQKEIIDSYVNQSGGPFDFIFVDGCFRQTCIAYASKNLTENGFCMVHDTARTYLHVPFSNFKHYKILTPGEINSHNDYHQGLTILYNFEGDI